MPRQIDTSCATIISIFPHQLPPERKPGLNPSEFAIPRGSYDNPQGLIITDNVFYNVDPDILSDAKDRQLIRVPVKPMELAQSIIQDYVNGLVFVDSEGMPGLFPVKGDFIKSEEIKERFIEQIKEMDHVQRVWFHRLVDDANDIYSKSKNGNAISDLQRTAAKYLDIEADWLRKEIQPSRCPYCKSPINEGAIVCTTCNQILNELEYDKIKGRAAKGDVKLNPFDKVTH